MHLINFFFTAGVHLYLKEAHEDSILDLFVFFFLTAAATLQIQSMLGHKYILTYQLKASAAEIP